MQDLDAIIFDLDNTLLDRTQAVRRWLLNHCRLEPALLDDALATDDLGYSDRALFNQWVSAHTHFHDAAEVWRSYQDSIGSCVDFDPSILALLHELQATHAVGILTNGTSSTQRPKLNALRIGEALPADHIVVAGEIGHFKPAPEAFEVVLRRVGATDPTRAVYVGDNPHHDIEGARAVGIRTCWIAHGRTFTGGLHPDWIFDSIKDFRLG